MFKISFHSKRLFIASIQTYRCSIVVLFRKICQSLLVDQKIRGKYCGSVPPGITCPSLPLFGKYDWLQRPITQLKLKTLDANIVWFQANAEPPEITRWSLPPLGKYDLASTGGHASRTVTWTQDGSSPPSNIQTVQTAQGRGKYWSRCVASWAPFFSLRIESAEANRPYSG